MDLKLNSDNHDNNLTKCKYICIGSHKTGTTSLTNFEIK